MNIVERGSNHGWPYREGNQVLSPDQRSLVPLPEIDKNPTQIGDEITDEVVTPKYPVIQYPHDASRRRRHRSGLLYNGKLIPDCAANTSSATSRPEASGTPTTRRCWPPMRMATPRRLAKFYRREVRRGTTRTTRPMRANRTYDTMFPINEMTYHFRGGKAEHLASRQKVANQGRADARLARGWQWRTLHLQQERRHDSAGRGRRRQQVSARLTIRQSCSRRRPLCGRATDDTPAADARTEGFRGAADYRQPRRCRDRSTGCSPASIRSAKSLGAQTGCSSPT